jgi:hypothetical protein
MNPYAKPNERKVGATAKDFAFASGHRCSHPEAATGGERSVAAERRAIKKSARRHLKQQLLDELQNT